MKLTNTLTVFFYCAIVFYIYRLISGQVFYLYLGILLGFCIFAGQVLQRYKLPILFLLALIIAAISYIFTLTNNGISQGMIFLPHFLACSGIAWRIHTHGINHYFCLGIFYGSILYCLTYYLAFNLQPHELFDNSRNHVSVYFINVTSLLYISCILSSVKCLSYVNASYKSFE